MTPEWSHKVNADHVNDKPMTLSITANSQVCTDVARRVKVNSIENLVATVTLMRERGSHLISVRGTVTADVTQGCVITTVPVKSRVYEEFETFFSDNQRTVSFAKARHERLGRAVDAELQILDEHEDPEPVQDGHIDLGELATQYLSLGIDPYPQAEGVALAADVTVISSDNQAKTMISGQNPFAALKNWKARQDKDK